MKSLKISTVIILISLAISIIICSISITADNKKYEIAGWMPYDVYWGDTLNGIIISEYGNDYSINRVKEDIIEKNNLGNILQAFTTIYLPVYSSMDIFVEDYMLGRIEAERGIIKAINAALTSGNITRVKEDEGCLIFFTTSGEAFIYEGGECNG